MASTSTPNNQSNNYNQLAIGSHLLKLLQAGNSDFYPNVMVLFIIILIFRKPK